MPAAKATLGAAYYRMSFHDHFYGGWIGHAHVETDVLPIIGRADIGDLLALQVPTRRCIRSFGCVAITKMNGW
jgi:hypothetical protein